MKKLTEETKVEKYLQKVSQCLYNIGEIIDAHYTEPIEIEKELGSFYWREKEKLSELIKTHTVELNMLDPNIPLADNLLFSKSETENSKEKIEKARDFLSDALTEVEKKRKHKNKTTGIEEGELKEYLKKYLNKKQNNDNKNSSNPFWIIKKENGDYFYDGNFVDIKNKGAKYIIIFDTVYSVKPQGGQVKYEEIVNLCKTKRLKVDKKSIQRALTGNNSNFFRYVKINQYSTYNIPLFRASQDGKYLEFNNKKLV